MSEQLTLADMMIHEVTTRWPATIAVFNKHRMACVGCTVAPFYTVADAAGIYNLSVPLFVAELKAAIARDCGSVNEHSE
jgi:hybrid cluster-associated redox disulfide protein